ncbi:YCF48-related protein [Psychroflexus sp. ALD_RP9]|uniref:T9SS type A sorting domain-containing protein n=1 Tax=Psychroflexus sp. ALD_RP9 TaxID=2777186 RepID=UPI001A8CB7BE|nr:YCF48-related protein [Psychroflexus sp. ALD_RP9]QSS96623.1 T9SS type A sorting domain-containing protein [Psychroflexus sp. ALD_RP9]
MLISRKCPIYIIFLFLSTSVIAQDWIQRNPLKNISDITEIQVSSDQTIFALDASTTLKNILISTDNGLSYKNAPSLEAKDIHMLTDDLGFLVANNKLIKTSNKFETIEQFTLNNYGFSNVFFLNENIGFVSGGSGRIHKTIDGGLSWQELPTNTTEPIRDVFFINENIGFACGEERTFISTTDGGNTWNEIVLPIESYWNLNKILFINSIQGIIVGSGGHVFNTNDGGVTWTEAVSGTTKHINDVKYNNGKYVAVCDYGIVLQSTDMGINWSNYEINYWKDLLSVAFSNDKIYIGSEGEVFQSIDNGNTWTTHLDGVTMSDLEGVSFANENDGLIVGIYSANSAVYDHLLFRTTDGGINWEEVNIPSNACCYVVHFLSNGKAITTNQLINKVAYSSDYGDTWSTINGANITEQFIPKAAWLKSENDFFVGGGFGWGDTGLYRYQNSIGWTFNSNFSSVESIQFLDNEFGVLGTVSGFYKTNDGGDTWTEINYNGGSYSSINLIDANTFYIGQYITTDGGNTFSLNQFPGYVFYYKFFDANYALGLSSSGSVYRTLDAGNSWQLINDNTIEDLNCCNNFYISENTLVAVSHRSDIFTLDIEATLSNENFESTENKFFVYPNPTSDILHLKEINTKASKVIIYNPNGQIVKSFSIYENRDYININDLANGVYFLHIESDSQLISVHRIVKK